MALSTTLKKFGFLTLRKIFDKHGDTFWYKSAYEMSSPNDTFKELLDDCIWAWLWVSVQA